jgi:hypothetical protein
MIVRRGGGDRIESMERKLHVIKTELPRSKHSHARVRLIIVGVVVGVAVGKVTGTVAIINCYCTYGPHKILY